MISDWLQNAEKKSSRVDKLCCACALSCKNRHNALSTNGRARGCVCGLILVCTFLWLQTDKVYLFLAADLFISRQGGYGYSTSRVVIKARRPHTCSMPCAFKKKQKKRNPAAPKTHHEILLISIYTPRMKRLFCLNTHIIEAIGK